MSQASKRKVELFLSPEDVGEFLQKLGGELDQGALIIGNTRIETGGYKSLGLSIKSEGDGLRVKLKMKFPKQELPSDRATLAQEEELDAEDECGAEDDFLEEEDELLLPEPEDEFCCLLTRPRPKYKSLKKRMKSQFKAIKESIGHGEIPEKALVHAFAKDSELMITYPDEGEEYYKPYELALQRFLVAVAEGDVEAVSQSVTGLEEVKTACHDKHK